MTKDQIAELERRFDAWKRGSAYIRSADGDAILVPPTTAPMAMMALAALPRLLDERRRLLEALKATDAGWLTGQTREAIAFAEEDSTTPPRAPPPPPESQE